MSASGPSGPLVLYCRLSLFLKDPFLDYIERYILYSNIVYFSNFDRA